MKVAVLVCSYNRVKVTLECLRSLKREIKVASFHYDIYLTDDNSPDRTGHYVRNKYPDIHVLNGTGDLYWGGGMNMSWEYASGHGGYDFVLWLNDDMKLVEGALVSLEKDVINLSRINKSFNLVGTCIGKSTPECITYGGRNSKGEIIVPNGSPKPCHIFNGNFVLIGTDVQSKLGFIDEIFTHSLGDFDYSLRSLQAGFSSWVCSEIVAQCDRNDTLICFDSAHDFAKRLTSFRAVTGFNIAEYLTYTRRHYPLGQVILKLVKVYFRLCFPKVYNSLKGL